MLVCGDIHGNYSKAKAFLEYKPSEQHLFTGDYVDSFIAKDEDIARTFKLIFEDKNSIKLVGNHELHYLSNVHNYMMASGRRNNPIYIHLINMYKHDMKAAVLADNYIITHAGITKALSRNFTEAEDVVDWVEEEWKWYINNPVVPESLSLIFNIGSCRGGRQHFGGPFWADYRFEKFDNRFNQIFGHSHSKESKIMEVRKQKEQHERKRHILVDCPKFECFNTITGQMEDCMFEEYKTNEHVRYMLEKLF